MTTTACSGIEALCGSLDHAVQAASVEEVTARIKDVLARLIRSGSIRLSEDLRRPLGDHYARRLLHRSQEHGYEVIAMIWGPGQGTPLHDHAGVWCVEGVLEGEIEVVQYELADQDNDRYRFEKTDRVSAHLGMSGSLIPPHEYHTIRNSLSDGTSITLHVYGRGMNHCHVFDPMEDGWFRKTRKPLRCDPL